jgi:hypothetical protein
VFSGFINLKVGLSLGGSASYDLAELTKVLAGEQLQKGSELVIIARYYVADVHMPVSRDAGYDYGPQSRKEASYSLGNAKLDLKLIQVEKIDVHAAKLKQTTAGRCTCLVPIASTTGQPLKHKTAKYPLTGYWASIECQECHGDGYVLPRENKAPLSQREIASDVIILVDELPEPPDIPEGGCPQCGGVGYHAVWNCPVREEEEAARKAAQKAEKKAAKEGPAPVDTDTMVHTCPHGPTEEDRGDACPCDLEDECQILAEQDQG